MERQSGKLKVLEELREAADRGDGVREDKRPVFGVVEKKRVEIKILNVSC